MIGLFDRGHEAFEVSGISTIRHVDPKWGKAGYHVVSWKGGGHSEQLLSHEYRDLMTRPQQLIPAEAGLHLMSVFADEEGQADIADIGPILAWALSIDGQVRPVLPSGVRQGYNPDGQIYQGHDYVRLADGSLYEFGYEAETDRFDSSEAVLAHETRRAQQARDEQRRIATALKSEVSA